MIKKIIYLSIMLVLFAVAAGLVMIAPYHIYTLTLTEGVNTRFLKMEPAKTALYDGEEREIPSTVDMNDEKLYQTFHFGNFRIPLPFNHLLFYPIPSIRIEADVPRLGMSFQNGKGMELFSFKLEKSYALETTSGEQKLFLLPIFKNYISRKDNGEVWSDLFQKKLALPSNEGKSFFESLKALRNVSYNDLVYNLYILYNRRFFIPKEATKLFFIPDKNMGVVELESNDPRVKNEKIYIIEKGLVYPIVIKTQMGSQAASNMRAKFIREIEYKASTVDSAIPIYARYKQLSYNERINQQGMTYLYSAWSHDIDNKDFVRVIILFLERGKLNLKYLSPFYNFAYRKFGSTFAGNSGYLSETPAEALKRKIDEELKEELNKEANREVPKTEGKFSGPEEKINYHLQKAKENKKDSDDDGSMLSIE